MSKALLPTDIRETILSAIKPLNPYKVILFGSYAYGEPHRDSDVDILFVSNEESYKDFAERMEIKMQLLKSLRSIDKPIDLLAYTKKEWNELVTKNSSFIRQINQKGVLLESSE